MRAPEAIRVALLVLVLCLGAQGCAPLKRGEAVPPASRTRTQIPGIPNARCWGGRDLMPMVQEGLASLERERAFLARTGYVGDLPPAHLLAISGGGDRGAFGAGLLIGWTDAGNRPKFKLVTGVSTGALIAPFAFLGPEYDADLKSLCTTVSQKNIFLPRNILAIVTKDAMSDTGPMWELLSKKITEDMLARIAQEYQNGRLLLVGTTDIDAGRPVIWNMGAIAASGDPGALELFRKVLLASAAIPGAFPPVMIDVEVDGMRYQEMHVDGGAVAQVFLYPPGLMDLGRDKGLAPARKRNAYIIRNASLDAERPSVERRTLSISKRAIDCLLQSQGIGDLYTIYYTAQKDGLDFNLAYIGADFSVPHKQQYDSSYMSALFDYGYRLGRAGYPWKKSLPGLAKPE
jgi:hypothetical protein